MEGEDWCIGESLDAFNDILFGGVGVIKGNESIELIWKDFDKMKSLFGKEFTIDFYQRKLEAPEIFNSNYIQKKLDELYTDQGKTYFQLLMECIADHPNIKLIPQ